MFNFRRRSRNAREFSMESALRSVREATRWVFCGTLIYAPWAYGTTTAASIVVLDYLLAAVAGLWTVDVLWRREWPVVPRALLVSGSLLLVLGWAMTWNARGVYDAEYQAFAPMAARIPWLPGSSDGIVSEAMMLRVTLLLFCVFFVAELVTRPVWLLRIWSTVGIAGGSIALLGLLQKGSGARMIFWEDIGDAPDVKTFFATYYYHANAGAFLNLVMPLTVGLALRSLRPKTRSFSRAVWMTAGLLVIVAVIANTSRMSEVLGILLIGAIALGPVRAALRVTQSTDFWRVALSVILVAAAIVAVGQASQLDQPWKRWQESSASMPHDLRWPAAKTAIRAIPDAGLCGFGPGTFRAIFPQYADRPGSGLSGTWRFLHEDYLQTLLEWGLLGSALLATIFFGGMMRALRLLRRSATDWMPRHRLLLPLVLLALTSVALHAFVDFPMQIASIQLYVATYLGICWGATRWHESDPPTGHHVNDHRTRS